MKLKRREAEVFSMSFLDCICCGFGAIILLLVLTDVNQPVQIERARVAMDGQLLRLQQELYDIRGETELLNRELQGRIDELKAERTRLARAQGELSNVQGEFRASRSEAAVTNIVENELVAAYQELTAEMERLQRQPQRPQIHQKKRQKSPLRGRWNQPGGDIDHAGNAQSPEDIDDADILQAQGQQPQKQPGRPQENQRGGRPDHVTNCMESGV